MKTNDNLVMAAGIMSILALLMSIFLAISALVGAKERHDIEVRLIELEQETVIAQRNTDHVYHILVSMGVISKELARRQLGLEERE